MVCAIGTRCINRGVFWGNIEGYRLGHVVQTGGPSGLAGDNWGR